VASASEPIARTAFTGPRPAVPTIPTLPVLMPPTEIRPSARTSMYVPGTTISPMVSVMPGLLLGRW
jgi:hypothetical protein